MKRNRTAVIVLLVFAMLILSSCGTKTFELENITKIELRSGSNGEFTEITDSEQIQTVLQSFVSEEFEKDKSSDDNTGWSYRLKFYQDDKMVTDIVVMNESRIDFDGYFYDTKEGTINISYFEELLTNNADEQ